MNVRTIAFSIVMLMLPTLTSGQFFQYAKETFRPSPIGETTVIIEEWSVTVEEYWIEGDTNNLLECQTSFANWLDFSNNQRIEDASMSLRPVPYLFASPLWFHQKDLSPLISLFKIK